MLLLKTTAPEAVLRTDRLQIWPVGPAAVHPPVAAALTSWETSLAVGAAFQEDGFLLFGVRLGTALLYGPFRAKNAPDSPLGLSATGGRERAHHPQCFGGKATVLCN